MIKGRNSRRLRVVRHRRVRRRVSGLSHRPRLSVFRSLNHIYAQIVDDSHGETVIAASSLEPGVQSDRNGATKSDIARAVGMLLAQRAKGNKIRQVVFDRGGFKYHGRVRQLAEGAREGGLEF